MRRKTDARSADTLREFRELTRLLAEGADLSLPELEKRPGRWGIFHDKMEFGRPFTLKTSAGEVQVTISRADNPELYDAVARADGPGYKDAFKKGVVAVGVDGVEHRIASPSSLRKDPEFGGKGAGSGTSAESSQIGQINSAIEAARAESGGAPVNIELGGHIALDVVKCVNVPGVPKADAALVDSAGREVAFVSLKSANAPKEMNQWSGVTKFADHEEVKKFACDLRSQHADGVPSGKVYYREIADSSLKQKSVWGAATQRGVNLIDVVIATKGKIELQRAGENYRFTVTRNGGIWFPNDPPSGDWDPTLTARKGDRDDLGIPKTRVGIFPKGYRGSVPLPSSPSCEIAVEPSAPAVPIEPVKSKGSQKEKTSGRPRVPGAKPPKPQPPPLDPALGESVTAATRLLLEELFPRIGVLERYGITESYVTDVLGLPRPVLVEGRMSESEVRLIIREHLIFESWWDKAKEFVGSGIEAVKEKGESAAGVLKKYGEDSKSVVASLWAAASDPSTLVDLLAKFKSRVVAKSNEVTKFLGDLLNSVGKSAKGAETVTNSLKGCLEFVKKAAAGLAALSGWKGMMAAAAGCLGFEWLAEKIEPLKKKIGDLLKGSATEEVTSVIQGEIVDFITNKLVEIGGEFAASAIEQLAGPAAWLKSAFTVFEKSAWVLDKMSSIISTATEQFEEKSTV